MPSYGYEYFCGANILLAVEGQALIEAAAISYNLIDSSVPIYGYSSRLFDAVAPGQRIIQGSIAINWVHPNYLYGAIIAGKTNSGVPATADPSDTFSDPAFFENVTSSSVTALATSADTDSEAWEEYTKSLKNKWWGEEPGRAVTHANADPLDLHNINIDIVFGGKYKTTLISAYLIGRGSAIQIDENVILEEYPFFARDLETTVLS